MQSLAMSSEHDIQLQFRSFTEDDLPFVMSSWFKSYFSGPQITWLPPLVKAVLHRHIEGHLRAGLYSVTLAVEASNPTQVFGWICNGMDEERATVHYIYVKHLFRRLGIARALLRSAGVKTGEGFHATHYTRVCSNAEKANYKIWYYPELFYTANTLKTLEACAKGRSPR